MARVSKEYYDFKKREIIDATLEVCKKKTVSSITMQDVINAAELSQGAIYRYYKNIDEVLIDLLSRIRVEQYDSADKLNAILNKEKEEIFALRAIPIDEESIKKRREKLAGLTKSIYEMLGEEMAHFLYPHRKIQMEFTILADNFPERARVIFPGAEPERGIDVGIWDVLKVEIEDGVISPRISLEEFMEYNASVYEGIIRRAIMVNCYRRNAFFDDSNGYDIRKRYETFAKSSAYFLGLEEYFV